jgi:rubrerythrin
MGIIKTVGKYALIGGAAYAGARVLSNLMSNSQSPPQQDTAIININASANELISETETVTPSNTRQLEPPKEIKTDKQKLLASTAGSEATPKDEEHEVWEHFKFECLKCHSIFKDGIATKYNNTCSEGARSGGRCPVCDVEGQAKIIGKWTRADVVASQLTSRPGRILKERPPKSKSEKKTGIELSPETDYLFECLKCGLYYKSSVNYSFSKERRCPRCGSDDNAKLIRKWTSEDYIKSYEGAYSARGYIPEQLKAKKPSPKTRKVPQRTNKPKQLKKTTKKAPTKRLKIKPTYPKLKPTYPKLQNVYRSSEPYKLLKTKWENERAKQKPDKINEIPFLTILVLSTILAYICELVYIRGLLPPTYLLFGIAVSSGGIVGSIICLFMVWVSRVTKPKAFTAVIIYVLVCVGSFAFFYV